MTDASQFDSTTDNDDELPGPEDVHDDIRARMGELRRDLNDVNVGDVDDIDVGGTGDINIHDESFNVDIDVAALPLPTDLRLAGQVLPPPSEPTGVTRIIMNRMAQMGWHLIWWGGKVFMHNPGSSGAYVPLDQGDDDKAVSSMVLNALEPAVYVREGDHVAWNPAPRTVGDVVKTYELKSTIDSTQDTNFWFGRTARENTREFLEERYPNTSISRCFDEALRPRGTFETRPVFINTRDGILWCRYESVGDAWAGDGAPGRIMLPHTPGFFTTTIVDCHYDPDAPDGWGGGGRPSRWLDFVGSAFDDPQGDVTLREWFGYLVSGRKDLEKMLFIIGPTRSGKGTIAEVMEQLMGGQRHVMSTSLSRLSSNGFSLESAVGKRLILVPDAEITSVTGGLRSTLLSLSSTDTIAIDKKHKAQVSMKLPGLVVVVANEVPKINDASTALAERMLILRTARTIAQALRDPNLKHYLTTNEMTGILHWALDGLDRLMENGATFTESEVMTSHIEDERERMAGPVYRFAQEHLVLEEDGRMNLQALHERWKDWVIAHDVPRVDLDARYIIDKLRVLGHPIIDKGKTVRHPGTRKPGAGAWGLRFATPEECEEKLLRGLEDV